ncbi:MAG: DUF1565 domain-containing protein [Leptolyngbyaceae cyanobacterium RM1_1_2]|nr:DUF1565 domain-containing protein [Leptolyngbyaceae cyanobacterium RM1_1_2]
MAQAEETTAQARPNGQFDLQPESLPTGRYQVLHVHSTAGSDSQGNGAQRRPLRTITYALQIAQPNTIILLAPGLYNQASGETFPLRLKPGVTVQGAPASAGHTAVIQGGGQFVSPQLSTQNVAIVAADRAGLAHVTVTNPNPQGHGLWIEEGSPVVLENVFSGSGHSGIFLAGTGAPTISGNYFYRNAIAGVVIYGENQAEIYNNRFEETGAGITVSQSATPRITGNQIVRNREGVVLLAGAQPVLQNNDISQNRRNGLVEFGDSATLATARYATPPEPTAPAEASAVSLPPAAVDNLAVTAPPVSRAAAPATSAIAASLPQPVSVSPLEAIPAAVPAAVPNQAETASLATPAVPSAAATVISPTVPVALLSRLDEPVEPAVEIPVGSVRNNESLEAGAVSAGDAATPDTGIEIAVSPAGTSELSEIPVTIDAQPDWERIFTRLGQKNSGELADPLVTATAADSTTITAPPATQPEVVELAVIPPAANAAPAGAASLPAVPPAVLPALPADLARLPAVPNSDLLLVPSPNIPVGSGGGVPYVFVSADPSSSAAGPPPPPSRATALGLYYRVIVEAADEATQTQVRSLVPDAFRIRYRDQTMMQAGAFEDQATADDVVQRLTASGLRAWVEDLQ